MQLHTPECTDFLQVAPKGFFLQLGSVFHSRTDCFISCAGSLRKQKEAKLKVALSHTQENGNSCRAHLFLHGINSCSGSCESVRRTVLVVACSVFQNKMANAIRFGLSVSM